MHRGQLSTAALIYSRATNQSCRLLSDRFKPTAVEEKDNGTTRLVYSVKSSIAKAVSKCTKQYNNRCFFFHFLPPSILLYSYFLIYFFIFLHKSHYACESTSYPFLYKSHYAREKIFNTLLALKIANYSIDEGKENAQAIVSYSFI